MSTTPRHSLLISIFNALGIQVDVKKHDEIEKLVKEWEGRVMSEVVKEPVKTKNK